MKLISAKLITIIGIILMLGTIMISDFTLSSNTFYQNVTISPHSTYYGTVGKSTLIDIKYSKPLNVTYYGGPVFDVRTEKIASATAFVITNNYSYTQEVQAEEIVVPAYMQYEYISMTVGIFLFIIGLFFSALKKLKKVQ
ncbi:hypothetical protein [Sulfuracidifex tepidarius]|uniref:Uncharacterized protein n=1 Tax=Sulfuracidifex tepidarius TaxID=1294262 RepID=A0A510DRF7_9CREN|nr:hypothetical protein [Sulfuracidifex tepidarius]BBG22744.1 hypothetical protein IC006_0028 [Sulfuracidifex tepidarius]BBG25523.1 hypothetical protein IC007_0028 [Sulfuracidifex tepidarius]